MKKNKNYYSQKQRTLYKFFVLTGLLLILAASSSIPFIWESQTIWYKFGLDKYLLRAGKIAGICAAILLLFQIILAIRLRFLDGIAGLDKLIVYHKINGTIILFLVALHALLITVPEGLANFPIGWKFWPEMLGMTLFTGLAVTVIIALNKQKFFSYHLWLKLHKAGAYSIVAGVLIHIIYVSESFEKGLPRYGAIALFSSVLSVVVVTKSVQYLRRKQKWKVIEIGEPAENLLSVKLQAPPSFYYTPGQFAYLSSEGERKFRETHPFTIASSSSKAHTIQFIIKKGGYWTENLMKMKDRGFSVSGPYGLFSPLVKNAAPHLVFIAAGIGITPFISLINYYSQHASPSITLIWSLRWKKDMFLSKEFEKWKKKIPKLQIFVHYSRENEGKRLDQFSMERYLSGCTEKAHIYICGPPAMLEDTKRSILALGYKRKNFHWENFSH